MSEAPATPTRVSRLAGAILVASDAGWFLVGNPKEPLDLAAAGFAAVHPIDAMVRPFIRLEPAAPAPLRAPVLELDLTGEAAAARLAAAFVIERNGSVSDRLWRLVLGDAPAATVDARWLGRMPLAVWQVVRDTVLKCS
jgi:hypothetical protein